MHKIRSFLTEAMNDGIAVGEARGIDIGRARTLDAATAFMRENGIPAELISKFKSSFADDMQK